MFRGVWASWNFRHLGFRISGLGFGVSGLGFGVSGLGFREAQKAGLGSWDASPEHSFRFCPDSDPAPKREPQASWV